jgi:fatty-acyl-CoA synthase
MAIFRLLYTFRKTGLLSIGSMFYLLQAIFQHGVNLYSLLQFCRKKYPQKIAITDDEQSITYLELYEHCNALTNMFSKKLIHQPQPQIAIISQNHIPLIQAIFAASRLGATISFIHSDFSNNQIATFLETSAFDLILVDTSTIGRVPTTYTHKTCHIEEVVRNIQPTFRIDQLKRRHHSKLVLLTSGTTGTPKKIQHNPSLFNYLDPFLAMVQTLNLLTYRVGYIATPIYHGYGLANLFLLLVLGKTIILTKKFDAQNAARLLKKHEVALFVAVPVMLYKLLATNTANLSLRCIVSGGAPFPHALAKKLNERFGPVFYNLYGTSETGLNIIGTPTQLLEHPNATGSIVNGICYEIRSNHCICPPNEIGELYIKSKATMFQKHIQWMPTNDLAFTSKDGTITIVGRYDEMIISGGNNVYPLHIESTLLQHENVADALVIAVEDEFFTKRLVAYVTLDEQDILSPTEIESWLNQHVARYERPKSIIIVNEIPYTPLGKKDRKRYQQQKPYVLERT